MRRESEQCNGYIFSAMQAGSSFSATSALMQGHPRFDVEPLPKGPSERVQEKQKLSERQIEELSGRVSALELEKQELQRALEAAKHAHEVHRQVLPFPLDARFRSFMPSIASADRHSRCCMGRIAGKCAVSASVLMSI